jgi:surface carbohydrate biosynthesis protein
MIFDRLKLKLKNFWHIFILPSKQWKLPKKSEILIYDAAGGALLHSYLTGYSVTVISLRGESVNIPCLIRAFLKRSFWGGDSVQAYVDAFVEVVSPDLIITVVDNNSAFYSLSRRFSSVKTIFLQNGTRSEVGDVFGYLVKLENYHVDYMLVHGSAIGKHYQKYISGNVIEIGSFINNHIAKSASVVADCVLFISQYSDKLEYNELSYANPGGAPVSWERFFFAEVKVLQFLAKWCSVNDKVLRICGRTLVTDGPEKDFYANCLNGCEWEYLPKKHNYSSYELLDSSEIVVFIDSTLGYEAISRGKKTAGFSCRGASLDCKDLNFGWPASLPENGPFWTNEVDESQFQRIMDYLNTVDAEEWEQTRKVYTSELMEFDAGNTRTISLINMLLLKT